MEDPTPSSPSPSHPLAMKLRRVFFLCVFVAIPLFAVMGIAANSTPAVAHASGTDYYVDCSAATNGTGTQSSPWNTLASVNAASFQGGDSILLARGTTCSGTELAPQSSGSSDSSPITIDSYNNGNNSGAQPIIDGGTGNQAAIKLYNVQYWNIQNIEVTGGNQYGIWISGNQSNAVLNHFDLTNVVVHDVNGSFASYKSGLVVIMPDGNNVSFANIVINGVTAYSTQQWYGIVAWGNDGGAYDNNVTVENSTVHDVDGDGILLVDTDNGLLQNNVAYNTGLAPNVNNAYTPDGIWTARCQTCTVQDNEAYQTHSPSSVDGGDFDIDGGDVNDTVQYNYGHDADGYCTLVLSFIQGSINFASSNDTFRYNICANNDRDSNKTQGDVLVTTNGGSTLNGVQIYNNTFYWNPASTNNGALFQNTASFSGSNADLFENNLIYAAGSNLVSSNNQMTLNNNLYWYTGSGSPSWNYNGTGYSSFGAYQSGSGEDSQGKYADPLLNDPTSHSTGMPTTAFTLQAGSPAIDAGATIGNMGSRDFFGNAIPQGNGYDIGADESPYAATTTPVNFVSNPGLESGSLGAWSGGGSVNVVNHDAHSGTYALESGGAMTGSLQTITGLTPNTNYTLTGWMKSSDGSSTANIGVKDYGGSEISQATTSTTYTEAAINFTTGSSSTSATIYMWQTTGSGTTYADDFSVAANLVSNPGLESGSLGAWSGGASVVNHDAHSGTYALETGGAMTGSLQTINGLIPNTTYVLVGWMKTSDGSSTANIGVKDYGGPETPQSTTSSSYVLVSIPFTTGTSSTSATIYTWQTTGSGTTYADDFSVYQSL